MLVIPCFQVASEQLADSVEPSLQAGIGANQVLGVLSIEQGWYRIVKHLSATSADHDVDPPIMSCDLHVWASGLQQIASSVVEDHGIASADVLHQGIAKRWWARKQRRVTEFAAIFVNQFRTGAI
ncbi:hypothetical protein AD428_07595 [Achromobacter sp. DMS1]|nr:hypothetical protein AD428_08715 [Achromobacter sp. DMS1]KOF54345.1 hypothetical protein AD428_07595 [Achromobacter sp. DMS1]